MLIFAGHKVSFVGGCDIFDLSEVTVTVTVVVPWYGATSYHADFLQTHYDVGGDGDVGVCDSGELHLLLPKIPHHCTAFFVYADATLNLFLSPSAISHDSQIDR